MKCAVSVFFGSPVTHSLPSFLVQVIDFYNERNVLFTFYLTCNVVEKMFLSCAVFEISGVL